LVNGNARSYLHFRPFVKRLCSIPEDSSSPKKEEFGSFVQKEESKKDFLNTPKNIVRDVIYDIKTGKYLVTEKENGVNIKPPMYLTFEEYMVLTEKEEYKNMVQAKIASSAKTAGGAKNQANSGQSLDDRKTGTNAANPSTGQGRQMAIVLMSDGQSNMGPELKQMADLAVTHQVKIYTVGIGTTEGDVVQMQGRSMRVKLEDEALKKVSAITQGEYFKADSAQALKSIYNQLGHRLRFEKRAMSEVTAHLSILGLLLVLAGVTRSFVRMGKII
jgi:Ca-activated chloride channel family protein